MDLEMGLAPKSLGFEDRDKKLLVRFIHKQWIWKFKVDTYIFLTKNEIVLDIELIDSGHLRIVFKIKLSIVCNISIF